jgi:hypothetical protein
MASGARRTAGEQHPSPGEDSDEHAGQPTARGGPGGLLVASHAPTTDCRIDTSNGARAASA